MKNCDVFLLEVSYHLQRLSLMDKKMLGVLFYLTIFLSGCSNFKEYTSSQLIDKNHIVESGQIPATIDEIEFAFLNSRFYSAYYRCELLPVSLRVNKEKDKADVFWTQAGITEDHIFLLITFRRNADNTSTNYKIYTDPDDIFFKKGLDAKHFVNKFKAKPYILNITCPTSPRCSYFANNKYNNYELGSYE